MTQTKERLLHHVTITVFCKPHDQETAVLRGLDHISPVPSSLLLQQEKEFDPERPNTVHYRMRDIELTVQQTPTDDGMMIIFTLFYKRMQWVNALARRLAACMTAEERSRYAHEPQLLLDTDGKLSLRLDKELLIQQRMVLTDDGNCFQVKASIAAYPKNEERTLTVVKRILD